MESAEKLELIDQAIRKLLSGKKNEKETSVDDDNEHHLLNRLLSELESLKGGNAFKESEDEVNSPSIDEIGLESEKIDQEIGEEIVKELKHVKKQNFVTHCLLSALIVVTLAWQLSEVSLILKLKDGVSHPFRSFGGMLAGMIKFPGKKRKDSDEEDNSEESPIQLPHVPDLGLNGGDK